MFKRLSVLIVASLLSANAMADDNWTGWYVGGNIGQNNGHSDTSATLGGAWSTESAGLQTAVIDGLSRNQDPKGMNYGVQLGYAHSFDSGFMLGAELGYNRLNVDASNSRTITTPFPTLSYAVHDKVDLDDEVSLRGKIGYAAGHHSFYGTAGLVRVDTDMITTIASTGNYLKRGHSSDNLSGYQFGAGYEYDFGNQVSLRAEILRTNLEDTSFTTAYQAGSAFTSPVYSETIKQDPDYTSFRVGVNYRF